MNWRDRFSKFMYGRYGADQFSKFLLGLTIALCIISLFVPRRLGSLFSTLILLLILECFHVIFISVLLKTKSICVFSVAGATRLPMRRTLPVSASIIISTSVRDVARGFVFLKDTVRFRFVALSATPLL
mgnify:FL=1